MISEFHHFLVRTGQPRHRESTSNILPKVSREVNGRGKEREKHQSRLLVCCSSHLQHSPVVRNSRQVNGFSCHSSHCFPLTKALILSVSWVPLSLGKQLRLLFTSYEARHSLLVISSAAIAERSPIIPGSVTIIKGYSKKLLNVLNKITIYIHNNEFWQQTHHVYIYKSFKLSLYKQGISKLLLPVPRKDQETIEEILNFNFSILRQFLTLD